MIKVVMISTSGRGTDLFPENATIREVMEAFRVNYESAANTANGTKLDEEDLDSALTEYSRDDEMRITSIPRPAADEKECPKAIGNVSAESLARAVLALQKAREALDEAITALGVCQAEDVPF